MHTLQRIQSDSQKIKILRLLVAMIVIIIVTALTTSFVFAATCNCGRVVDANGNPKEHEKGEDYPCTEGWDWLNKIAFNWGDACNLISVSNWDWLYKADFSSGVFGMVWSGTKHIYLVIEPIGYMLVILYFLLDVIEHTTRDTFNLEQLLKMGIKLFIGIMFIQNGLYILEQATAFGSSLVDLLNGEKGVEISGESAALYGQAKEMGWFDAIGVCLGSLAPYILSLVCALVIALTILSRYIEIAVRALFAPIGMANIFTEGLNSSGMKYFKKYVAVCLQGAIMSAIMIVHTETYKALITGKLGGFAQGLFSGFLSSNAVSQLILMLCTAAILIKSKNIANDLLGVTH